MYEFLETKVSVIFRSQFRLPLQVAQVRGHEA